MFRVVFPLIMELKICPCSIGYLSDLFAATASGAVAVNKSDKYPMLHGQISSP